MTSPHYPHITNRLRAIMLHINYLSFEGQARLAKEAGVSPSAISRMVRGLSTPSFAVVLAITRALEKRLGKRLDPREILTFNGDYPTPSVCDLCGCKGCLPDAVFNQDDTLRAEYRAIRPGHWPPDLAGRTTPQNPDTS